MKLLPAFIFDMNGTMIDDMRYHVKVWHNIINRLGGNLTMEEMKEQCYGKNGEMLERIFPGRFKEEEKKKLEIEKETYYQEIYRTEMKLIPGLQDFLDMVKKCGIHMGIGSAAIMFNINFILDGLYLRQYFDAIVSAEDVTHSKPHPETFLKCAEQLAADPANCIVFEDAPKGVEAAINAGMLCVVLTTLHNKSEFKAYDNIICFANNYKGLQPLKLFKD